VLLRADDVQAARGHHLVVLSGALSAELVQEGPVPLGVLIGV
jgi:hypothetical protein